MHLQAVREPEPLHREREHPVHRPLQLLSGLAARQRHPLGPGPAVAQVEVLLQHDLVQPPLPGAVGALLVDVSEQAEAGLVVEEVGRDQLGPALQGDVEGVGIPEGLGITREDELLLVLAQLLEDVVRDVGVRQLVLDDRDPGHEGVDARGPLGGQVVGGGGDQLGVAGHDERVLQLLQVLGGHLRGRFDELAPAQELVEDRVSGCHAHLLVDPSFCQHSPRSCHSLQEIGSAAQPAA